MKDNSKMTGSPITRSPQSMQVNHKVLPPVGTVMSHFFLTWLYFAGQLTCEVVFQVDAYVQKSFSAQDLQTTTIYTSCCVVPFTLFISLDFSSIPKCRSTVSNFDVATVILSYQSFFYGLYREIWKTKIVCFDHTLLGYPNCPYLCDSTILGCGRSDWFNSRHQYSQLHNYCVPFLQKNS